MAIKATINATTLPINNWVSIDLLQLLQGDLYRYPKKLFADAASIVGTARKNENSAAALRVNFWLIPVMMVAALLLRPGNIMDNTWPQPIIKAVLLLTFSSESIVGFLKTLSINKSIIPPQPLPRQ